MGPVHVDRDVVAVVGEVGPGVAGVDPLLRMGWEVQPVILEELEPSPLERGLAGAHQRGEVLAPRPRAGGRFDPARRQVAQQPGGGLIVEEAADGSSHDTADAGQSRIGTDGSRLLAARDDGGLGLWSDGARMDIYSEGAKLRGAVLADIDPDVPGLEAATAGYEMRISVLYPQGDGWSARQVFTDTGRFHHLAAGELLSYGRGTELVSCGYSKRLVVIGKR